MSAFSITSFAPEFTPRNLQVIDDDEGNGNGRLDPGETAVIKIITSNTGHCLAYDVTASLVAYNPFITVLSGDTLIPVLSTINSATIEFNVSVSDDAPEGIFGEMQYRLSSGGYNIVKTYYPRIGLMFEDWESGNFEKFAWQMGGDTDWLIDYTYHQEGYFSAASGDIGDNEFSEISIDYNVMQHDSIIFYKKFMVINVNYKIGRGE